MPPILLWRILNGLAPFTLVHTTTDLFGKMEISEVNFTSSEYENGGGISNIWTKIIGLAMYFIGCLGIILFFGIIHYEKFGQDSQKRSFPGISWFIL